LILLSSHIQAVFSQFIVIETSLVHWEDYVLGFQTPAGYNHQAARATRADPAPSRTAGRSAAGTTIIITAKAGHKDATQSLWSRSSVARSTRVGRDRLRVGLGAKKSAASLVGCHRHQQSGRCIYMQNMQNRDICILCISMFMFA
jgi:hypothetical protein